MRTVQEIFDEAIHLIDAQNESNGSTSGADTREYAVKAAKLLSSLLNEAYPFSDTYQAEDYDRDESYEAGQCALFGAGRWLCIQDAPIGEGPKTDSAYWIRTGRAAGRPTLPPVTDMISPVYLDDFICLSALPAGLAALFVFDEDKDKYNAFWGDYQTRLRQAAATLPATDGFENIENPYGDEGSNAAGIEYGEFGHW